MGQVDGSRRRWRTRALAVALVVGVLGGCQMALGQATSPAPSEPAPASAQPPALAFPDVSTVPQDSTPESEVYREAQLIVSQWSRADMIASLFLIHIPGSNLDDIARVVGQFPVAGVLLLPDNLSRASAEDPSFLASIRGLSSPDLLLALDQEGGGVSRIRPDTAPSATELGHGPPEETTRVTRERNTQVFNAGANVNLGVVADVSPGGGAFIDSRSFSTEADVVATHVAAAMEGSIEGVATAIKHFPGHGLTALDTHRDLAVSEISMEAWREIHSPPFREGVQAGAPMVMLSHVVAPALSDQPASLSREWIGVLRNELGFQGVVVTDDLSMLENTGVEEYQDFAANARVAIAAGADLVLDVGATDSSDALDRISRAVDVIDQAVDSGLIEHSTLESAAIRVVALRLLLGGVARPLEDAQVGELGG